MKTLKLNSVDIPTLNRSFIGLNDMFERMSVANAANDGYPPYNIIAVNDNEFIIKLAVAGMPKDGFKITEDQRVLKIEGNFEDQDNDVNYIHKGISSRRFARTFNLAEHVTVRDAMLENGILSITLEREVPEELKPRVIAIDHKG
ncbi:MAG: Hsp20 family protein [Candidatus Brocadiales bacterium]|nr:Hsp20 family protein [Candidatus Brocadiales bacterium]